MEPHFEEVYDDSVVSLDSPRGKRVGVLTSGWLQNILHQSFGLPFAPQDSLHSSAWNMVPRLDDNRYQFANKEEAIDYLKRVYYKQFSIGR